MMYLENHPGDRKMCLEKHGVTLKCPWKTTQVTPKQVRGQESAWRCQPASKEIQDLLPTGLGAASQDDLQNDWVYL